MINRTKPWYSLIPGRSHPFVTRGVPGGGPTTTVAGSVPLQTTHAAHDQRGLHTVPEHTPILLPGELHLLPGSLQPQGAHPQVSPCSEGQKEQVSAVLVVWIVKFQIAMNGLSVYCCEY